MTSPAPLAHKLAVLVFLENEAGELLLLLRAKAPNLGVWSPIGGKLETARGESPFECAVRETLEETGLRVGTGDFHLFAMIAEKAYEGHAHWLMFLFEIRPRLTAITDHDAATVFTGLQLVLLGILLALPIPFTNYLFAGLLLVYALALLERDGVLMLIAWAAGIIAIYVFGAVSGNLVAMLWAWIASLG